jgi:hypothetical protein
LKNKNKENKKLKENESVKKALEKELEQLDKNEVGKRKRIAP